MNAGEDDEPRQLIIMLVAGEPSGDQLGAQLMNGLKAVSSEIGREISVVGIGGEAMTHAGLESIYPIDATSVMGLREVVPRIPEILRRVRRAIEFALKTRPDLVVLIDSPDFTHRIARGLKRAEPSLRTANYPPPQVWASRAYRARKMARYMDAVLAILPFEAEFFERYGIETFFVGFPIIERKAFMTGGKEFRERHRIDANAKLLAVLPGSRRNEIRFILPPFKGAVQTLADEIPNIVTVIPTIGHIAEAVREGAENWPTPLHIVQGNDEKFAAFDAADAALAASGSVTSELALARTPMVVGYRTGWLTYALARPLMNVPFITLINLVLGRKAIPEFIQFDCTARKLADAIRPQLSNSEAKAAQIGAMEEALVALGEGGEPPSLRAARAVLEMASR
ncbi:MAG: lipid-A-disaccharide synthase [Micropepsaceae bacterium]